MTADWRQKLDANQPIVIDGGTGSQLQHCGVPVDPVCWHATAALTHHAELVSTHIDFISAGASVITTNTFATHRYVLERAGRSGDYARIMQASVAAARRARIEASAPVAIAGSMSCMPPGFDTANYPHEQALRQAYAEHANMLADLGVDLIALEMIQDTRHGRWALEAAASTGLPVWLGVSCRLGATTNELVCFDLPQVRLEDLWDALLPLGPAVVNIMHTPIDAVAAALDSLRPRWDGPMGVYPEVGSFDVVARTRTVNVSPSAFAAAARQWLSRGAAVLGGCCGAGPAHIAALSALVASADTASGASASAASGQTGRAGA